MLFKSISTLFVYLLCSLTLSTSAFAVQQADFSWLPNEEVNLAGYKIYYSNVSGQYDQTIDVGNPEVVNGVVKGTVTGLVDGTTYYFAATAYDSDGLESDYSQQVVWTTPVDEPALPISPPIANDVSVSLNEDSSLSGQLDGYSPDSLALTYQIVDISSKGTTTITDTASGTFIYTPYTNINGTDTFTYKVNDINGESVIATVTISINSVNDQPAATVASFITSEDTSLGGILSASDVDNDQLVYTIINPPSIGDVVLTNAAIGTFDYIPHADVNGSDTFTFQVSDGVASSTIATVEIGINAVNDASIAQDGDLNVEENQITDGILLGSDIDSSQLTYSIVANGYLGSAIIVDPALGTYTYTPNEGAYGEDSFQFVINDGSGESNQGTVAVTIQQSAPVFTMEIDEVTVDGTWAFITFTETFRDPVVVAKAASNNDPSPCVVRIRNLSSDGFEIRLQNYDYLASEHGLEQLAYIAVERGSFLLENGKRVEAGMFSTNVSDFPETKTFMELFPVTPVVAASIVTENEYDAVLSRVKNITENGFEYHMQEQEANSALHTFEDVAYIAWEPFSGMIGDYAFEIALHVDEVSDQWLPVSFQQGFDRPPVLIASMQSQYGQDTANLRHSELTATGVQVKVAEEQSLDSETVHVFETLGFMAISVIDLQGDADNDGLITAEERDLYGTSPGAVDTDEDGLNDGAEVIFWGIAWDSDADSDGSSNLLDPDSDNDGFLDGAEVALGFDPADSNSNPDALVEPTPDPVTTVITLEVNAAKVRGQRTAELFWSGASGDSAQITRIRENDEVFTVTVPNENYYKDILAKSGIYTYQVCETDGSVCSDIITVGL